MIKLLNESKEQVALLTNVTDLKVVKDLNSIEQIEFNFTASADCRHELKCERYLRLKDFSNEYIIKEINDNGYDMQVIAICNIEDLQGNAFKQFTSLEQNINDTLLAALNGSGWTYELNCDTKKRRTLRKKITNTYDVLADIKKIFRVEYKFDALNKIIYVYDKRGSDRGSYFMSDLNLVSLTKEGHTYDLITRIYPIGKDDLTIETVNNGKSYVENLSYKNKVIAAYWKDERYTIAESLRDDAALKLADLAKPYVSYKATVKDLAAINGIDIHMYDIGDTVTIIDKKTKTRDSQRIVKLTIYPNDPDNNTCEIASHALTFEDLQAEKDNILNLAGDTIGTDGTINSDDINGSFEVEDDSITGDKIKAEEITAEHIKANSIYTHHLTANSINSDKIQANSIKTTHLEAKSITADKIQTGTITAGSGIIADGAIGSAQISEIDAAKINAGKIDTSKVIVAGPDNNLKLTGNRLQVFTGTGLQQKERVSLGDVNGDGSIYGLRVRGADGETILLDENGVKSEGITDGSITNDKISDNANIDGAKLNINSVISKINEDGTDTISGTKIDIEDTSLSVKLSEITSKQDEDSLTIKQNTASIKANKDAISTKVSNQVYEADKGQNIKKFELLQSDINQTKDSITSKVEKHEYDAAIKAINSETSRIDQKADNINLEVSKKVGQNSVISSINQTAESIKINANKLNLNGYVTISDLGDYITEDDLGKYGTTTIHGGRIETDSIKLSCLDTNSEDAILKLFPTTAANGTKGYCSIDATQQYEQGRGSAIRLKWDSMNYMLQKRSGVDFYMEPRESGNAFGFQSDYGQYTDKYETRIVTKEGTLCFRRNTNTDASTSNLYFYTGSSNYDRKLLTSYDISSSVSSTSTLSIANSYAVKTAYDKAVSAYNLANHSHPYASSSHTHSNYASSSYFIGGSTTSKLTNSYSTTNYVQVYGGSEVELRAGSARAYLTNYGAWSFYPANSSMDLGGSATSNRWRYIYSQSSVNTSDAKYKEDIQYLDDGISLLSTNSNTPFLDFIRDDFKPATYNYKAIREEEGSVKADRQIGFIANDIMNSEVGKTFLYNFGTEEDTDLMFSPTGYTTVVAKALQEEIKKREELEEKHNNLQSKVNELEEIIKNLTK